MASTADDRDRVPVPDALRRALAEARLGLEFEQLPADERRRLAQRADEGTGIGDLVAEVGRHRVPPASEESASETS